MQEKTFKNLIFDLGGVIIDLSVNRTIQAFCTLSGFTEQQVQQAYGEHPEFFAYERGEISDEQFRASLKRFFSIAASDEAIDHAWNAMLVGLPKAKLELLEQLGNKFSVGVLSNTNNIHLSFVNQQLLPSVSSAASLNDYFHIHYYSHLVGKRKPELEIFEQVLSENGFYPEETLFLDDNKENIEAAEALGIKTFWVKHPDSVFEFFKRYE
ncbi:MAG: HAD family phosphatase [Cyclobacteriaceae bacterium]|nr:HAD family phosphatase [Cyclobacteriaceae bacterium]